MDQDTIEIKVKIVEESVKVSELNEREKKIHAHGYDMGFNQGVRALPSLLSTLVVLVMFVFLLSQCGH